MARTTIASQNPLGTYPATPIGAGGADLLFTAPDDPTDRQTALVSGKTVVFAYNTDASARTVTFTSVVNSFNRLGHITAYSIDAGEIAMFGPFSSAGWSQAGSMLYIDVSNPLVRLAVLRLP